MLKALYIKVEVVAARTWQSNLGLGKGKDASRNMASILFPDLAKHLTRVQDHNRADALLIAEYGRRSFK
jgi:hypothetical protein